MTESHLEDPNGRLVFVGELVPKKTELVISKFAAPDEIRLQSAHQSLTEAK